MAGRRRPGGSGASGVAGAARAAWRLPERARKAVVPVAFWTGWAGVAGLLACGALALLPTESWPASLDPDRLPLYVVLSLCVASLIGWGCVQDGQERVRRAVGRSAAMAIFLVLPLACTALSLLDRHLLDGAIAESGPGRPVLLFARWYAPALIGISLLAYLAWRTQPRRRIYLARGFGLVLLVTPYVLLLAVVLFDLPAPWVEQPVEETLDALGESSVAAHLIVGYFLADGPGD